MITLADDRLSFTFPEIARQLRAHVERQIGHILPEFLRPEERTALLAELESRWEFQQLNEEVRERHRLRVFTLTADEIEAALRTAALSAAGLDDASFPALTIAFQRTLRIPDDGRTYPLPAGLGAFPLRSVDDYPATAPASWLQRGGVVMPMYQSEALWISFSAWYPFAVKIAAGKINAVSGEAWTAELQSVPQNYVVVPGQPWLDGFSVGEGLIRQFVAMPLGAGYSVEEQLTGKAEVGGMQFQVYPLSLDAYYRDKVAPALPSSLRDLCESIFKLSELYWDSGMSYCLGQGAGGDEMGLGAGGKMRQEIYQDPHKFADWDQTQTRRCFVHLCNSLVWRQVTGANPPHPPLTAKEYQQARIPWFDYYRDDLKPLKGSKRLAGVKSVAQLGDEKNSQPLPENSSIAPELIVQYGNTRRPGEIRAFLDSSTDL
jgi:hypothetical protein